MRRSSIFDLARFALVFAAVGMWNSSSLAGKSERVSDVTEIIQKAILSSSTSLSIRANNQIMEGDPAYKTPKKLKVEYSIDGVDGCKVVMEGAYLHINVPAGKKLIIKQALYGALSDEVVDVTEVVATAVKNSTVTIEVGAKFLGGNPAPGKAKTIRVRYTVNGVEHTAAASQDEGTLTLPLKSDGSGALVILSASYGPSSEEQ